MLLLLSRARREGSICIVESHTLGVDGLSSGCAIDAEESDSPSIDAAPLDCIIGTVGSHMLGDNGACIVESHTFSPDRTSSDGGN